MEQCFLMEQCFGISNDIFSYGVVFSYGAVFWDIKRHFFLWSGVLGCQMTFFSKKIGESH
jgi:hypothetical protein